MSPPLNVLRHAAGHTWVKRGAIRGKCLGLRNLGFRMLEFQMRAHGVVLGFTNYGSSVKELSPARIVVSSIKVAFKNGLRLTVDFRWKSWPKCRLWFQKLTDCRQLYYSKKKRNCCNRLTVNFSWILLLIFNQISVGKWKNSYKMASKSSKNSVEVNSRLRGRSS
jgi:hypothetical protein